MSLIANSFGTPTVRVPDVSWIMNLMQEEGLIHSADAVQNDHIVFRTLGVHHLDIQSLEKNFLHYGHRKKDYYFFSGKKLDVWCHRLTVFPASSFPSFGSET